MATRNIVKEGDPILRKKSRPVFKFDEKLWTLLDDMKETLDKAEGAGLAAVQVGVLRNVVIVNIDDGKGLMELINPSIVEKSKETNTAVEGCLSFPGKWASVERPSTVVVRAQNREGKWCLYKGEGLRARCFCHEIDHLKGKVFLDRSLKLYSDEEFRQLVEDNERKERSIQKSEEIDIPKSEEPVIQNNENQNND